MANPPIKEQPVYQPFTPPQASASNGGFSTGLVWAILVLILCCNPIAIASIVLSAIAGGEFNRGDIENAQKHANLSKKITLAAFIVSIAFVAFFSMIPANNTDADDDDSQQEEVENNADNDNMSNEEEEANIIEVKLNQDKPNNGVKLKISPNSSDHKEVFEEFAKQRAELEKAKKELEKSLEQTKEKMDKSLDQSKNDFDNTWEEQRKLRRSKQQSQD